MKALNDYIRESLLDDEEELIGRSIKDSQDPLKVLVSICNDKNNEDDILNEFDKGLFDNFLRNIISIDIDDIKGLGVTWRVVDLCSFVSISLITKQLSNIFVVRYFKMKNYIEIEILKPGALSGSAVTILQLTNYFKKYRSTLRKLNKLGFEKSTDVTNWGAYRTITYKKQL